MICYYVFNTVPVIPEFLSRPSQIQSFSSTTTTHPYDNSIISPDRKEVHPRVPREISNYEYARVPSDFTYNTTWLVQDITVSCHEKPSNTAPSLHSCLLSSISVDCLNRWLQLELYLYYEYDLQTIGEFPKEKWAFGIAMTATTNWSWSQTIFWGIIQSFTKSNNRG